MDDGRRKEGNQLLGLGAGVGAWGAASALLLGAVCPVCVVATPALVGLGLLRRWQAGRPADLPREEEGRDV
ncbi:MAG TPA: hypothetical protein VLQ79_04345 [Myxococcaceae bacterium]|nr:hypothetical protein [Myxococcaceae bacterium]